MTDDHTRPTRQNIRSGLDDLKDEAEPGDPDGPPEVTFHHVEVSLPNGPSTDADDRGDGSAGGDVEAEVRGPIGGFTAKYDPATGDVDGETWGHVDPGDAEDGRE